MKLGSHKRWDLFDPLSPISGNMVIVGWPRSGKSEVFRGREDVIRINIRECVVTNVWALPEGLASDGTKVAVLDNFEYEMDNVPVRQLKLTMLSELFEIRTRAS
jgi:hypothetical protein